MQVNAALRSAQVSRARNQDGTARGFVPFIGDGNTIDDVMRIAFRNRAVVMSLDGTTANIAEACDRNAVNRDVGGAHTHDLAAVRGGVTEANDVTHRGPCYVTMRTLCRREHLPRPQVRPS